MIYKNSMLVSLLMVCFLAAGSGAQEEKQAPKRVPARPASNAKPAEPKKDAPQQSKAQTSSTTVNLKEMPTQATVEMIMNEAVKNIARRYNLNEDQKRETDRIMKRDVNKFLKDHETQIWPIIRDLMANGFQPPSNPDEVKRLGSAIEPLIKKAQKAILDGNEEWRKYLTDEQKVMHDYDLREMEKQFVEVEKSVKGWAEGKSTGSLFPPTPPDLGPPTPKMPPPGLPRQLEPQKPALVLFNEDLFEKYVEDFIKQYQLDPGQIDTARSILAEYKSKANDFKEANRAELTKVAQEHKDALDAKDPERIAKAETDRKKVLEPVYVLFSEMDGRLKAQLTLAQRERHGDSQPPDLKKHDPLSAPSTAQGSPTQISKPAAPPPPPPARATDKSKTPDPASPTPETPMNTP